MSSELVAVEGCTLECENGGTAQITTNASGVSVIKKKGIYRGTVTVSVAGSNAGGADGNASGTGTFTITAEKATVEGMPVLRMNDEASVTVYGTHQEGQTTRPTTGSEKVTITDAGQNVVKAT